MIAADRGQRMVPDPENHSGQSGNEGRQAAADCRRQAALVHAGLRPGLFGLLPEGEGDHPPAVRQLAGQGLIRQQIRKVRNIRHPGQVHRPVAHGLQDGGSHLAGRLPAESQRPVLAGNPLPVLQRIIQRHVGGQRRVRGVLTHGGALRLHLLPEHRQIFPGMGDQAAHGQAARRIQSDAAPGHQHVHAPDPLRLAQGCRQRQAQGVEGPVAQPQGRGSQVDRHNAPAEFHRVLPVQGQLRFPSQRVHLVVGRIAQQLPGHRLQHFRSQDSRDGCHMPGHQVHPVLGGKVQRPQAFPAGNPVPVRGLPAHGGGRKGGKPLRLLFRRPRGASAQRQARHRQRGQQTDGFFQVHAPSPFPLAGRVTVKQLPRPGSLSTEICPP